MKGLITGIVAGVIGWLLLPNHPILAMIVWTLGPIIVLGFWTGAVGIKFERRQ